MACSPWHDGPSKNQQVNRTSSMCLSLRGRTSHHHHQTAAGNCTHSTAAAFHKMMTKWLALLLSLPSKLAEGVWGPGHTTFFPTQCSVSFGSIFGPSCGGLARLSGISSARSGCWGCGCTSTLQLIYGDQYLISKWPSR